MRRTALSHDHHLPFCLHCSPRGYIRMVQHMIERCLLLKMTRDDCVEALAKRAGIKPPITRAVWKELMKENRDFFHAHFQAMPSRSYQNCQDTPTSMIYGPLHSKSSLNGRKQVPNVHLRWSVI